MSLKSQENGVKGELRTEAYLSEKFWILSRSVDSEGADFLVQKRNEGDSARKEHVNLAIVQAKFVQDERTEIKIPKKYVLKDNEPLNGFFVMIHTGEVDKEEVYFLSAGDIKSLYDEKKITMRDEKYVFKLTHIKEKYCVKSFKEENGTITITSKVKEALEQIENSLTLKEILSELTYKDIFDFQLEDIDPEYRNDTDLINDFYKIKELANEILVKSDDLIVAIQQILTLKNPKDLKAFINGAKDFNYLDENVVNKLLENINDFLEKHKLN
jgi:mRNA-degrading endonuclease HigB of HigAB toxin-antitoxin module